MYTIKFFFFAFYLHLFTFNLNFYITKTIILIFLCETQKKYYHVKNYDVKNTDFYEIKNTECTYNNN